MKSKTLLYIGFLLGIISVILFGFLAITDDSEKYSKDLCESKNYEFLKYEEKIVYCSDNDDNIKTLALNYEPHNRSLPIIGIFIFLIGIICMLVSSFIEDLWEDNE